MKKLLLLVFIFSLGLIAGAQFSRARLQATGLTCALCSNAINKALQKLPFVRSVNADIKNSAFDINFKSDQEVEIEALRKAVEDAGFFVGGLQLTGFFTDLKLGNDDKVRIGKNDIRFLDTGKQTINGEKTIRILNKEYLTAKDFKKMSAVIKARLQRSEKEENGKVIHATI